MKAKWEIEVKEVFALAEGWFVCGWAVSKDDCEKKGKGRRGGISLIDRS